MQKKKKSIHPTRSLVPQGNVSCSTISFVLGFRYTLVIAYMFFRYGFVEFEDMRDAEDAVYEMNGRDLCGERVIVEHARAPRREARSKFTICTFVLFSGVLKCVLLLQFAIG